MTSNVLIERIFCFYVKMAILCQVYLCHKMLLLNIWHLLTWALQRALQSCSALSDLCMQISSVLSSLTWSLHSELSLSSTHVKRMMWKDRIERLVSFSSSLASSSLNGRWEFLQQESLSMINAITLSRNWNTFPHLHLINWVKIDPCCDVMMVSWAAWHSDTLYDTVHCYVL